MGRMRLLPVLLPALLVSACSTMPASPPNPQKEVRGSVAGWTGGAGTVELSLDDQTLTSAPLSSAGKFTLPLPDAAALNGLGAAASNYPAFDGGCTRDLKVSAPDAKLVVVSRLNLKTASGNQAISRFETSHDSALDASTSTQTLLVYASAATQIYGEVSCASGQKRASYSVLLRLNAGWNSVKLTQSLLISPVGSANEIRAVTQFASVPLETSSVWSLGSVQALAR